MLIKFNCAICGTDKPTDGKEYDGILGYEAVVCKVCGTIHDNSGIHLADEWSLSYVGLKKPPIIERRIIHQD